MKTTILRKAEKQFRAGKYSNVIRILEPEVFNFRENENFYYYLGMSCLHLGDFSGANSYLRRALQINPSDSRTMLGLAVIHLKHNNPPEAIKIWLDILDRQPSNRYAKKGLDILKKTGALEKIPEDFITKNLSKIIPFRRELIISKLSFLLASFVIVLAVAALAYYSYSYLSSRLSRADRLYPELTIGRNIDELMSQGEFPVMLEGREIVRTFEKAKELFLGEKDNEARIEVNRILNSNASESVKAKARLLSGYLREPDYRYFQNTISYRDVVQKPYLYDGCHVKWSGKIANIVTGEKSAVFDFLVGYDSGRVLEGIIRVETDFPVLLDEEFTYDIIGRLDTGSGLKLKAVTLRNYIK